MQRLRASAGKVTPRIVGLLLSGFAVRGAVLIGGLITVGEVWHKLAEIFAAVNASFTLPG